jgi:hypothetical protein
MSTGLHPAVEQRVKEILQGLLQSLERKRLSGRKLISDEEIVYNSLKNPRLGDIKVIVMPGPPLQVFVANRRDAASPFAVMDPDERRNYVERRPLDEIKDGGGLPSLYLISVGDREMLKNPKLPRFEFYSSYLNLSGDSHQSGEEVDLKSKPYESLTNEDRMAMLRTLSPVDPLREQIAKDLFDFVVSYARYKQPDKQQTIRIPPDQIREYLGQFSRDMYPQNLRMVLMRDFPADHDRYCAYVKDRMKALGRIVQSRLDGASSEYAAYLREILRGIEDQIAQIDQLQGRRR